jgi:hypothetical protein
MCLQGIVIDEPFSSSISSAEQLDQPRAAVLKYMRKELRLCRIKFCWVPHELSEKARSMTSK